MTEHTIDLAALAAQRAQVEHSIFAPSASSLWLYCAGGLIPNLLADETAEFDAAWGTVFHDVTEQWLKTGKKPLQRLGTIEFVERVHDWYGFFVSIDAEMLDAAQMCVDAVELEPGIHYYERRVDFSAITPIPKQSGTADCIIIQPDAVIVNGETGARMIVADWKGGVGVQVFAENNTQGLLYALGAFYEFDLDYNILEIEIWIEQPRLDHSDRWVITRAQLIEFAQWAKPRAYAAWALDAPRTAGTKQCRWCKVQSDCATYAKMIIDATAGAFDNLDQPAHGDAITEFKAMVDANELPAPLDLQRLSVGQMVKLLEYRKVVDPWFAALEAHLSRLANEGLPIPGMKLVEGRSYRQFVNEPQALAALEALGIPNERLIKRELVSPAQAEELLREFGQRRKDIPALIAPMVRKPPGKPTLVPVSDRRPALLTSTEGVFESVESE